MHWLATTLPPESYSTILTCIFQAAVYRHRWQADKPLPNKNPGNRLNNQCNYTVIPTIKILASLP